MFLARFLFNNDQDSTTDLDSLINNNATPAHNLIFSRNSRPVFREQFTPAELQPETRKYLLVNKNNETTTYRMKVFRKEESYQKQIGRIRHQEELLKMIDYLSILNLFFVFESPVSKTLTLISQYSEPGQELVYSLLVNQKFEEEQVHSVTLQLIDALSYLHRNAILCNPIPDKLFLSETGKIYIMDIWTPPDTSFSEYLAPELLDSNERTEASEWWSLGTLMYHMLTGVPPFFSYHLSAMYHRIKQDQPNFPTYINPETQSLIGSLLCKDPQNRLGNQKTLSELTSHPYFTKLEKGKSPKLHPNIQTFSSSLDYYYYNSLANARNNETNGNQNQGEETRRNSLSDGLTNQSQAACYENYQDYHQFYSLNGSKTLRNL